jgi:hypothetical protein
MRRFEAVHGALLEDPVCGRPAGHNGQCRSVLALEKQRPKETARVNRWRRSRRRELQAQRRAVLAEALRGFDCDGWRHAA